MSPAAAAPEMTGSEAVAPGIVYTAWTDAELPANIHVVEIDLIHPDVDLVATAEEQRGQKVSELAASEGAVAAINGDAFSATFAPAGLARGAAKTWSDTEDTAEVGFISFYRDATGIQAEISQPDQVISDAGEDVAGLVGGRPLIAADGMGQSEFDCADLVAMPCAPAPRTAVALSADGNRMWLVVVDGWQDGSAGMTAAELGSFVTEQLGSDRALMLDSGSASSMWLTDAIRSSPSDGDERRVANHILVKPGPPAEGLMLGVVAERALDGERLPGAVITLDDGRATTYTGDQVWQFGLRPRYACVTATLAGYAPASECRHVPEGGEIYASLVLWPEGEVPDGGVADEVDGGANLGSDAGMGLPPEGGCGCSTGPSGAKTLGNLLVGLFVLALYGSKLRMPFSRSR